MVLCALLAGACDGPSEPPDAGIDAGEVTDAGTDAGPCQGPPGLFSDDACEVLAEGVRSYTPRYALWTDGADKERHVYLPPGEVIDTTDPNGWVFPEGTRLYKTFYRDGIRLETRLLEKTSAGSGTTAWSMQAFAWDAAGHRTTDVTNASGAERENYLGTAHDIPNLAACRLCHTGPRDTVAGFSAIQLNHAGAGLSLQTLLDEGLLSTPIAVDAAQIPGDPTTEAALGYLHANCGHCHHAPLPVEPPATPVCHTPACSNGLHFWTDIGLATMEETPAYLTAVNQTASFFITGARCRIRPGDPDASAVTLRMGERGSMNQMPPIGTEDIHPMGIDAVSAWIRSLSVAPDPGCTP